MSKEEFLKIQKCVLKVNIHCDGCKQKVKKILQKIDGVFTIDIDAEQGKVTVSGNVDPAVLVKKLAKSGKHAELWGAPKPNSSSQNQNHLANQFKGMQIDNGKGGNNNKGQKGGNNLPKGGQQPQNQQQQLQQQLQQLQQMKGLQDLKLPQFKDLKMPNQNPNQKAVKFSLPEDDDFSDDEFDDEFDDDEFEDDGDELDDEFDDLKPPLSKMKPGMPKPNGQSPNMMMNGMNGDHHAQLMIAQKGANVASNGKKGDGGGGPVGIPVQMNGMSVGNGGKKGGSGDGGGGGMGGGSHTNQVGGKQNCGKNGGGFPHEAKSGNNGGAMNNKNFNATVGGYGEGLHHDRSCGFQNMGGNGHGHGHPAMAAANMGSLGNMNMPPMAPTNSLSMGQTGSIPAVQGLPAVATNAGGGAGYFQGAGPESMSGNPYHQQQQYMAAMMNQQQQRAMSNDRYQAMMYARPPPSVNYMPPPYPYPYHPPPPPAAADPYTHLFSDENTSSCNVM